MKRVAVFVAVLCLMLTSHSRADEAEDAVKARAKEFAEAFNKHDAQAMDNFFSESAILTDTAGRKFEGKTKVKEYFDGIEAGSEKDATGEVTVKEVKVEKPDEA